MYQEEHFTSIKVILQSCSYTNKIYFENKKFEYLYLHFRINLFLFIYIYLFA